MPTRRVVGSTLGGFALFAVTACGGGDDRPGGFEGEVASSAGGSGGGSASSGSNGNNGSGGAESGGGAGESSTGGSSATGSGGTASSGGGQSSGSGGGSASGSGGSAGEGGEDDAVCGDGMVSGDEDCEPEGFEPVLCSEVGFETGTAGCNDDCSYDVSECDGTERCFDNRDNDGDGDRDCRDDDCEDACASSCGVVAQIEDGTLVSGNNTGHATELRASCAPEEHGPEVVYQVTASNTGVLEATLNPQQFPQLTVSIRTSCEDDDSELACAGRYAAAPVTEGQVLFVVVQGVGAGDDGSFELSVASRPANVCGDGAWDSGEACEDGYLVPGDGCDASCQIESTEEEPNDDAAGADAFVDPYYAEISPAGDEDFVEIEVEDGPAYVIANVHSLAAGSCALETSDPHLSLLDSDGSSVLETNDDYTGTCPRLVAEDLAAGTYYLRVSESPNSIGLRSVFPYELSVTIDWCGNDWRGPLEECDDGNTVGADGCDSVCQTE